MSLRFPTFGVSLAACALALGTAVEAQTAPAPAPAIVDPAPMMFPGWGFNPADLNHSVKPGDDFYAFVNGKWMAATEIPPQLSYYGTAINLRLGAERDVREIVEGFAAAHPAPGTIEQKIADTYRAFLNTDAINAAGLAPVQPYLQRISAAGDLGAVMALMGEPGLPSVIDMGLDIDPTNPTRNILMTGIGGLGLPDRDNYLIDNPRNQEMRAKYKDLLAFMLRKAGYSDPAVSAEAVYAFERAIAAVKWDRAISREPHLTTHTMAAGEWARMGGALPLDRFLTAEGLRADDRLDVAEIPPTAAEVAASGVGQDALAKLGGGQPALFALLRATPVPTLKAWMTAHFMLGAAPFLPSDIDSANFAFYGQYLQGRQVQRERWQRAVAAVEGSLGEAVGKVYVERHFPPSSKAAMLQLVGNLRAALADNLTDLAWMTPATRKAAQAKLDAFTVKIGYPAKFKTYDGLVVRPDAPLANSIEAGRWSWADDLRQLRAPIDKTKWLMTPQTVNAYYNPPANEIVFPAAYLQPPYFNPKADDAVNYGAIGATIGHEIGHGFDDEGSQYDGTGALRNWWTPADRKAFEARVNRLAAQYDKVCPYEGACHNGKLTLGENIGDLGGLSMAYKAYHMSLHGKQAPVIDGLTGDQRFFISYAQAWRTKMRESMARQLLQTDPHSLAEARVNQVLRNFDPWYKAFNVQPGDKLYLPPEQRVHIW